MPLIAGSSQPHCEPLVSRHVCYRLAGWGDSTYDDGIVVGFDGDILVVESDGETVFLDPRPWPVGNVLPF